MTKCIKVGDVFKRIGSKEYIMIIGVDDKNIVEYKSSYGHTATRWTMFFLEFYRPASKIEIIIDKVTI